MFRTGSVTRFVLSVTICAVVVGVAGGDAVAAVEATGLFDAPLAAVISQGQKNGDGYPLSSNVFAAWAGHFTSPRSDDAIVLVVGAASQAGGYVEAWLLSRNSSGWRAVERLGRDDDINVEFFDPDGQDTEAVLVQQVYS